MKLFIHARVTLKYLNWCIIAIVWKYFIVKKFSWVMKPTKIYYTKN